MYWLPEDRDFLFGSIGNANNPELLFSLKISDLIGCSWKMRSLTTNQNHRAILIRSLSDVLTKLLSPLWEALHRLTITSIYYWNKFILPLMMGRKHNERERFCVFIKILFAELKKNGDPELVARARKTVSTCIKQNKSGMISHDEYLATIQLRLLRLVGPNHWGKSVRLMNYYCLMRKRRPRTVKISGKVWVSRQRPLYLCTNC